MLNFCEVWEVRYLRKKNKWYPYILNLPSAPRIAMSAKRIRISILSNQGCMESIIWTRVLKLRRISIVIMMGISIYLHLHYIYYKNQHKSTILRVKYIFDFHTDFIVFKNPCKIVTTLGSPGRSCSVLHGGHEQQAWMTRGKSSPEDRNSMGSDELIEIRR